MIITNKYLALSDYEPLSIENKEKEKRIVLSDDAFAIIELINELTKKMEALRISSLR